MGSIGADLGFAGHVSKPVKQGELGTCLASILGYGPPPRAGNLRRQPSSIKLEYSGHQLRLLIVEDNTVNQEVALGILQKPGVCSRCGGRWPQRLARPGAKRTTTWY